MILSHHTRLVTAGCSFTEGFGLANPSKQSWPALLAKKMGIECVNLAFKGAGNEYIINTVIEYTLSDEFIIDPNKLKNCFFILALTEYSRLDFGYNNDKNITVHLTPNSRAWPDLCNTIYPQFYNDRYYFKKFLLQVLKAQSYFELNRLNYLMINSIIDCKSVNTRNKDTENIYQKINKDKFKDFEKINFPVIIQDGKLPDGHPNEIGHQRIADTLYKWISKKDKK